MRTLAALVGSLTIAMPTPALAAPLQCQWADKYQCDPVTGCKTIGITTFAKVDLEKQEYSRCDKNGCDSYPSNVSGGGKVFTNVDVTGRGMFLKIGPDAVSTEVVSLGNSVLISQGICR